MLERYSVLPLLIVQINYTPNISPNLTFSDSLWINLAGLEFELYAVNGETNDHLFVWCPSQEALFAGDNYYKAFPNLYAIRGSRYRDVQSWGVRSIFSHYVGWFDGNPTKLYLLL
jgi:alkyl sulfatase BDS1-like metallo-beta-lactamase superfamily hydrolase